MQGYRDRASERRQLYGQDDKPKSLTQERRMERLLKMQAQAPLERAHPPPESDGPVAAVDRPLGDDNIGAYLWHITIHLQLMCGGGLFFFDCLGQWGLHSACSEGPFVDLAHDPLADKSSVSGHRHALPPCPCVTHACIVPVLM